MSLCHRNDLLSLSIYRRCNETWNVNSGGAEELNAVDETGYIERARLSKLGEVIAMNNNLAPERGFEDNKNTLQPMYIDLNPNSYIWSYFYPDIKIYSKISQ